MNRNLSERTEIATAKFKAKNIERQIRKRNKKKPKLIRYNMKEALVKYKGGCCSVWV